MMFHTENARLLSTKSAVFAMWTYVSLVMGGFQGGYGKANLLLGAVPAPAPAETPPVLFPRGCWRTVTMPSQKNCGQRILCCTASVVVYHLYILWHDILIFFLFYRNGQHTHVHVSGCGFHLLNRGACCGGASARWASVWATFETEP